MSQFLYQSLLRGGLLSQPLLSQALVSASRHKTSLVEELVKLDPGYAPMVAQAVREHGEPADEFWRPDSRLLMELPPGTCERLLAFPFRERAGRVEVATVSPLEDWIRREFEAHLTRGVTLFRGSIQALLAAAGAPVDLNALSRQVSPSAPAPEDAPIPLIRKSQAKDKGRERMPTARGIGAEARSLPPSVGAAGTARPPTWVSPGAGGEEALREASNLQSLAHAISSILPAPALVFELRDGRLVLRSASGPGAYGRRSVSLVEESALSTAVEEGNYLGPWYSCGVHAEFATSFSEGTLVRVERIGSSEFGLIVAMMGGFDARRAANILDQAATTWERVVEEV